MAAAIPFVMMAGRVVQGVQQSNALAQNSATYANEAKIASAQGYEAEAEQRREGAQNLGRMVAAAGQSGAGYGGSTGRAIAQSSRNMTEDALAIRYKASLQKWAYGTQSQNLANESAAAGTSTAFRAGAALLRGYSNGYMGTDLG